MLLYHLALCHWRLGRASEAIAAAREAASQSPLFINPHRVEDAEALRTALQLCPDDALAHLLLGNCLASLARWDEAAGHWTRAAHLADSGETAVLAWRNLALFRWHKQRNAPDALDACTHALSSLETRDAKLETAAWRLWLQRDHVLSASGRHAERVAAFDSAPDAVRAKWQVLARGQGRRRPGEGPRALRGGCRLPAPPVRRQAHGHGRRRRALLGRLVRPRGRRSGGGSPSPRRRRHRVPAPRRRDRRLQVPRCRAAPHHRLSSHHGTPVAAQPASGNMIDSICQIM